MGFKRFSIYINQMSEIFRVISFFVKLENYIVWLFKCLLLQPTEWPENMSFKRYGPYGPPYYFDETGTAGLISTIWKIMQVVLKSYFLKLQWVRLYNHIFVSVRAFKICRLNQPPRLETFQPREGSNPIFSHATQSFPF